MLTNSTTHNNESKKTQHDNMMVAEQVLRDLSVRRASVVRSLSAQNKCVFTECADVPDVSNAVMSCPARKHCDSASLGSVRTRWSATTRP